MKHWIKSSDGDVIALADPDSPGNSARIFGIVVNDDGSLNIGEDCDGQYDFDATPAQLIEAFEEALVWLKEQARASDPLVQAMDDAVKRLADMGITASWMAHIQSGMEVVPEYFPGTSVETGNSKVEQIRPNQIIIEATLYFQSMELRMRGYKWRNLRTMLNANSVEVEFRGIEEVEQFIADNAHLAKSL